MLGMESGVKLFVGRCKEEEDEQPNHHRPGRRAARPGQVGSCHPGVPAGVPAEPPGVPQREAVGVPRDRRLRVEALGDGGGRSVRLEERRHHREELPRQGQGHRRDQARARPPQQGGEHVRG